MVYVYILCKNVRSVRISINARLIHRSSCVMMFMADERYGSRSLECL